MMTKVILKTILAVFLPVLAIAGQSVPQLSDIIRKADGTALSLDQPSAENYCKTHGMRLPTVRELALYGQSLGAGLKETDTYHEGDTYQEIQVTDQKGALIDHFYYSSLGYPRPADGVVTHTIWSSSGFVCDDCEWTAWAMNEYDGEIFYAGPNLDPNLPDWGTFRCVLTP